LTSPTGLPNESFDFTISFFVLEHLVWPQRFLREMVRVTRPGGRLAIICPHFRRAGRMPSLYHGGPASLNDKLRQFQPIRAAVHLACRFYWPWRIRRAYSKGSKRFLINPRPRCLVESWTADSDAVYLVDRRECVEELERLGVCDITDVALNTSPDPPIPDARLCVIFGERLSRASPMREHPW